MSDPKFLNLDELELVETDITIRHDGTDHKMVTLTVEGFLKQQLRADEQTKLEKRIAESGEVNEGDTVSMVKILRDSVQDFFPTLPVDELPTAKLLKIFGWLNELAMQTAEEGAPKEATEGVETVGDEQGQSAEGNGE